MERIRILHCLRVYSTYVRKQCKTRIRFFCVEITGKREILRSDSFGFVPFFRIRSDSFRLVEFYGVRGLCVFFVHMLGPPPPVFHDLRFLILLCHCFFSVRKKFGIRELYLGCDDWVFLFDWSRVACFALVRDTMQLRFFHCRGWQGYHLGGLTHVAFLHSYVILCNCAFFTVAGGNPRQ